MGGRCDNAGLQVAEFEAISCSRKHIGATIIQYLKEEEEEEEETDTAIESISGDPAPTYAPSFSDLSNPEKEPKSLESFWGPSQMIQEESESSCNDMQSEPEDYQVADSEGLGVEGRRNTPNDDVAQQLVDNTLALLRDRVGLQAAQSKLKLTAHSKKLDTVLSGRILVMSRLLNLFLDDSLGYTWAKAAEVVATAEGRGKTYARTIRRWVLTFIRTQDLPMYQHKAHSTLLNNEDMAHELKLALSERAKSGFLTASDVVQVVSSPNMQAHFVEAGIQKSSISESTARRWLSNLGWRYGRHQNGMYVDGHERDDVVEYRKKFVERFKEYEQRFHSWDELGDKEDNVPVPGTDLQGQSHLVLITHDESIFYQNDQRQIHWGCPGQSGVPKPKGEGLSLMISDFLTPDWGRLRGKDRCAKIKDQSLVFCSHS